jgi:uncharacterized protein YxjI
MFTNRVLFFVREHVGMLKLKSHYDIIDPVTKENLGEAVEYPGAFFQILRLFINKGMLPTTLRVTDFISNEESFRLEKSWGFLNYKVSIYDNQDQLLGYFKNKAFSFSGGFTLFDHADDLIGTVTGNWRTRDYQLQDAQLQEMGRVTKQWSGFGRELFTTADNYVVEISPDAKNNREEYGLLLLALSFAYDLVYTERS